MFASPPPALHPSSHVNTLTAKGMVSGGEAFGRCSGAEDGALEIGIRVLAPPTT